MSLYMSRPQQLGEIELNIGAAYGSPQNVHDFNDDISPGVDSELFDEDGTQGAIIFNDGIETGFVLVEES